MFFQVKDSVTARENHLIWISIYILIGKSFTNNGNLLIYNKIIVSRVEIYAVDVKVNIERNSNL